MVENVAAAAARELSEEVGIDVDASDVRFVGVTHHRPPHGDARVGFAFLADVPDGVEPVNREPDKCSALTWTAPRHPAREDHAVHARGRAPAPRRPAVLPARLVTPAIGLP